MDLINYDDMFNTMNRYVAKKGKITREINNEEEKEIILGNIFPSNIIQTEKIDDVKMVYMQDLVLLTYNQNTGRIKNNIVFVKENKPVFKMSHYSSNRSNTMYEEVEFGIYENKSDHLESRLSFSNLECDGFKVTKVNILDKNSVVENEYLRDSYEVYHENDRIVSIKHKESMLLLDEVGFYQTLCILDNRLIRLNERITNVFNSVIKNEKMTRDYQIKRKIQQKYK